MSEPVVPENTDLTAKLDMAAASAEAQDKLKKAFIEAYLDKIGSPECDKLLAAACASAWSAANPALTGADFTGIRAHDDAKVSARESALGNSVAGCGIFFAAIGLAHLALPGVAIGLALFGIFGVSSSVDRGARAVVFHAQNKALRDKIADNLRDIGARNEAITAEKALVGARGVKILALATENSFMFPLSWLARAAAKVARPAKAKTPPATPSV